MTSCPADCYVCTDDSYEENDSCPTATSTTAGNTYNGVAEDADYFEVNVVAGQQLLDIDLTFSDAAGDIDICLTDAACNNITCAVSMSDNEYIDYTVLTDGTYYIHVYPYGSPQCNTYTLWWEDNPGGSVCTDDSYEENDTMGTATDISSNEQTWYTGLVSDDDDYYEIYVNSGYTEMIIDLHYTHSLGNVDVFLLNSSGSTVASSASSSDNEYINFDVSTGGTYYIRVTGTSCNDYDLWWDDIPPTTCTDDSYEENDTMGAATTIVEMVTYSAIANDVDYYEVYLNWNYMDIDLTFNDSFGNIDLYFLDSSGTVLASSTSTTNNEKIYAPIPSWGTYYILVVGANCNPYDLWWDDVGSGPSDDFYEDNDTCATAYDMGTYEQTWFNSLISASGDDDFWMIDVTGGYQNILVDLQFSHAGGDINVDLLDSSCSLLDSAISTDDNEYIDFDSPSSGIHYIRVYLNSGSSNTYDLWWDDIP